MTKKNITPHVADTPENFARYLRMMELQAMVVRVQSGITEVLEEELRGFIADDLIGHAARTITDKILERVGEQMPPENEE